MWRPCSWVTVLTLSRAGWETPREPNRQWLVSTRPCQELSISARKSVFYLQCLKLGAATLELLLPALLQRWQSSLGHLHSKYKEYHYLKIRSFLFVCQFVFVTVCMQVHLKSLMRWWQACLLWSRQHFGLSICFHFCWDDGWLVYSDLVHCLQHWLHYSWQACVPLSHPETKVKVLLSYIFKGKVKARKVKVALSHCERKGKVIRVNDNESGAFWKSELNWI